MPLVSVLLSVWDGMPYLPKTVESVLSQELTDFEFIINDNGSTDGSLEYLKEAASRDPRIRLLHDGANHGHSGGLNRGLAECRAPWTARIDADDICLPHRLGHQLDFLRQHPQVKLAGSLAHYIDHNDRRVAKTSSDLRTEQDFKRYWDNNEMIGLMHPSVIYDTALVQSLGGYRPCGAANDMDLWCRIAESGAVILVQQDFLIEYRVHAGQISAGKFLESRDQYEWVRACALARRANQPEPSWDEFKAQLKAASWFRRLNRARKIQAKYQYRQAGLHWICQQRVRGILRMTAAALLQPSYAVHRGLAQRK